MAQGLRSPRRGRTPSKPRRDHAGERPSLHLRSRRRDPSHGFVPDPAPAARPLPMTTLVVHPATQPLVGSVPVPSDKSIGHRALRFGALCQGATHIAGFSHGEDNVSTAGCLRAMGVVIEEPGPTELVVHGVGLDGLRPPMADLDCGNSGTTMRLLCGVLAAQRFQATLIGDPTLSRRPMMRVAGPLRSRGAVVKGRPHPTRPNDVVAPLVVGPLPEDHQLTALCYALTA